MIKVTQVAGSNNSTSTANYERKNLLLGGNQFSTGTLQNATATDVEPGTPLFRAADGKLTISQTDWTKFVGIIIIPDTISLLAATPKTVDYCDKGKINYLGLTLAAQETIETVKAGLTIKDHIQSIGLHLETSTRDFTKYDN